MRSIFSLDSPIIRFMSRIWDLMVLNLLFLLCLIPVVTGGASLTALFKVVQNMTYDKDSGVIKPFFRAFRENFKAVTPIWLMFVLAAVSLVCDFFLLNLFDGGTVLYIIAIALSLLLWGIKCYFFPLQARYENTVLMHLKNAAILALSNLPRTLYMIFLDAVPVMLFMLDKKVFYWILLFWPVLGFSTVAYIQSALPLRKIFDQLEPKVDA